MSKKLTIIDYGLGNLFSVSRAFEHIGAEVALSQNAQVIKDATHLVLPGVGSFNKGMEELQKRGLVEIIREYAASGKPLLGICLGMQMLFETGEENGTHAGLGIIKGKVSRIPDVSTNDEKLKVPHIGWTKIYKSNKASLFKNIKDDNSFYFVHSYHGICANPNDLAAHALYGGNRITAVIEQDNIFGCQFHPEKSAENGLELCRAFMELKSN